MALTPFTGLVTQAQLRSNFDDATAALIAQALLGKTSVSIAHLVTALATGVGVANFLDFTAPDDMEVIALRVKAVDGTAGRTVTGFLEQTDGDTSFLLDQVFSKAVTTVVGTVQATELYSTTTLTRRVNLLRGTRYRLRLSTSVGPVTSAQATLVCGLRRRAR